MKLSFVHTLMLVLITTTFSVHADDDTEPRAALRGGGLSRLLEEDDYNKLGHHYKEIPDHMIVEFPPEIAGGNKPKLPFHQTKEDSDDDELFDYDVKHI